MDRSAAFLKVGRALHDRPALLYDRRGYGRSALGTDAHPLGFDEHVEDLRRLAGSMRDRSGVAPVIVGHSIGGSIALVAAARTPSICSGLVMYESPLFWRPWWPDSTTDRQGVAAVDPSDFAESFMRTTIGDLEWERMPERTRSRRRQEGLVLLTELRTARHTAPPALPNVSVPVAVGHGSALDPLRRRAVSELIVGLPDARSSEISGARHDAHVSRPTEFASMITSVCIRVDSPPGSPSLGS